MKKFAILLGLVSCVVWGQQKADIYKYYTKEQVKNINKGLNNFFSGGFDCFQLYFLSSELNSNEYYFKSKEQKDAYFKFFIYPLYEKFKCNSSEGQAFGRMMDYITTGEDFEVQ